jgi:hypothetical protein
MTSLKKTFIFALLFVASSLLTLKFISSQNELLEMNGEREAVTYSVEEVNPKALNELKNILLSQKTLTAQEVGLYLNDLTRSKTVTYHGPANEIPTLSASPLLAIWGVFALVSMLLMMMQNKSEHEISPLFKKSMDSLEYPVLLVDSSLTILWQNKKSTAHTFTASKLESIFDESLDGSEITLESKSYSVLVSELEVKGNQRNYLAHLIPKSKSANAENAKTFENNNALNVI